VTRFAARYPAAAHTFVSALDDDVTLDGESGHHLSRVRRLRGGEVVTAADGAGTWRPYTVAAARAGALHLHARGEPVVEPQLEPRLVVAFGLTKAAKPDVAVQKLTELGVDRITPLESRRSVPRWGSERVDEAVARLRRIAGDAAAQCRRARLPEVEMPRPVAALGGHPGLVDELAALWSPSQASAPAATVGEAAAAAAAALGAPGAPARLRLGPHVLRAETAAIAGAAVLTTRRAPPSGHSA
jgi:16S rRNA (uracil1498-N3)-methyltransferase